MMDLLTYLFYPNPGRVTYGSAGVLIAFAVCGGLIVGAALIRLWRTRLTTAITKKLSRSWSAVSFWFGVIGLLLTVSRVEKIQFVAMRFLWVLWALLLVALVILQYRIFRMRNYEVLPRTVAPDDPRAKYLPGKKK